MSEVTHCCSEHEPTSHQCGNATAVHAQSVTLNCLTSFALNSNDSFQLPPVVLSKPLTLLLAAASCRNREGDGGLKWGGERKLLRSYFGQLSPLLCGSVQTEYDWGVSHLLLKQRGGECVRVKNIKKAWKIENRPQVTYRLMVEWKVDEKKK